MTLGYIDRRQGLRVYPVTVSHRASDSNCTIKGMVGSSKSE